MKMDRMTPEIKDELIADLETALAEVKEIALIKAAQDDWRSESELDYITAQTMKLARNMKDLLTELGREDLEARMT
jgi:hypothetical protein